MSLQHQCQKMSIDDYLNFESSSDTKHEFIDGEIIAMTGASANHNRIVGNVFAKFYDHLKDSPCEVFMNDMKLKLLNEYRYPDLMVVCDKNFTDGNYATEKPIIIVEVLSKLTRKEDTTRKLLSYLNIPTLQEYVLIEQDLVSVMVMRKSNHWTPVYYYLENDVYFESIDLSMKVEDIYRRVDNDDMTAFLQKATASMGSD